ncbi:pyrophosphatase PpaX [Clostridium hydrogeniformans]|uniref:pyrophosphatase PpaX n=1 Tax=Clostridium hydrogeniformans TaxID=349933 RepID=UPI000485B2D6|nr:pyrophosphatase PpaX [Clostridium hydrogeniformans]
MIKAVLFDLDGTLIDTNKLIAESFKYTFKIHHNEEKSDKEVSVFFGQPLEESFKVYGEELCNDMIKTYREYNEKIHDTMCMEFEGTTETLKTLKSMGIKTAIVTSKRKVLAERGMKINGIIEYFDAIITPEDTNEHKPKPGPVIKACEILGVKPEEALMVGDSHFDLMSGKSAGAKICGVNYTALPIELLKDCEPDYFIDSIKDIITIVDK